MIILSALVLVEADADGLSIQISKHWMVKHVLNLSFENVVLSSESILASR